MRYHILALVVGFLLDLLVGDPYWLPHAIRLMGKAIAFLDRKLLGEDATKSTEQTERRRGRWMVWIVLVGTGLTTALLLIGSYFLHPFFGCAVEVVMTFQILATKCLRTESMKVWQCLMCQDVPAARTAVSMIVGRDTDCLDENGITRAAVETVAENTSDGVIAPLLYTAIGGPILGFLYKAVNTMDSMVGYKNERYLQFGRAAAKLDDVVNFIPARISAWLMMAACLCLGKQYDCRGAYRIYRRDRLRHESPNSAHTESVVAGALHIRLAGPASYFGKTVDKPYLGDTIREIEFADIRRTNRMMYAAAFLCEGLCVLVLLLFVAV